MTELPKGWAVAALGEIADVVAGQSPPSSDMNETGEGMPFFQGKAEFGDLFPETRKWTTNPLRTASAGDVLLSVRAPVGPTNLARVECAVGRGLMAVSPHPSFAGRYILWVLRASAERLRSYATGSTFEAVTGSVVRQHAVPVAPVAEQERIVAAIEEAFSKLDAGEAGLRTVRQLLKRMRDAILTAAVTGRLVPQDPTDTPATKLLADLGVEAAEPEGVPELPPSWSWARVQDVGQVDLGRQRSPKFHSGDNMKPYLRVANVFEDRIDTSDVMEMHFEPEAFERCRLLIGDILLNEGQTPELLGRPAMYRGVPEEVAFTNSLLRFRALAGVDPEWALLVFRQHMHSGRFTRESRITTNIAHLSAARFKPVEFPLPPIEEQRRVVEEFQRQSSFIDSCERAVDLGLVRSAGLRRSVLKAAFEGRLVPQDPSDEPASVLLERIRTERAAQPVAKRRAKQRA